MINLSMYILDEPPISGTIDEVFFNAIGECTWVLFKDGFDQWAGVFGRGLWGADSVIPFGNDDEAFVISRGQGYVVNLTDRSLTYMTNENELEDAIISHNKQFVIACDAFCLFMYNTGGLEWRSERISYGGIRLTHTSEKYLYGEVDGIEDWEKFSLDLESKKIQFD